MPVSIAGSGRFGAQGTAKTMDVSIAGSGDVSTAKVSTQDVKVSIAGSGEVRYYGEANLRDASTGGSGRVKQLGATPPV